MSIGISTISISALERETGLSKDCPWPGLTAFRSARKPPAAELVAAAQSHKAGVIALSFSIAFPVRSVGQFLEQIRAGLPASTEVWAGGASVDRIRRELPGIIDPA